MPTRIAPAPPSLPEGAETARTPSPTNPVPRAAGHVAELDGIRGLAILAVFLHHYVALERGSAPIQRLVAGTVQSLWCGVDLFFVLSGFLITGILLETRGSRSYFRTFFARRSIRIFPPYFALLAVALLILPRLVPFDSARDRAQLANQAWLWTYLANLRIAVVGYRPFQGDHTWLAHLWSLAVEEHFYLVWPWVVGFASPRALVRVCLGCVVGSLALRVGLVGVGVLPHAPYVATPCRIDAMAIGGLAALALRGAVPGVDPARISRAAWGLLIAAGPALLVLFLAGRGWYRENPAIATVGYTLFAVGSAGLILGAVSFRPDGAYRRTLRLGSLRLLGRYSYGLYLYHEALEPTLNHWCSAERVAAVLGVPWAAGMAVRVVASFAACFAVAALSWHLFERPILSLKRRFEYDHDRGGPTPAPAALPGTAR